MRISNVEPLDNATRGDLLRQLPLNRITTLLWVVVLAIVISFAYFASSVWITLFLSAFLAILIDPVITYLERFYVPRSVSSALVILLGMVALGAAIYGSYGRLSTFLETAPQYTWRIRDALRPLSQKIQKAQDTAGSLAPPDGASSKRVAEVKIKDAPTWPTYILRGVGSMWGAVIIIGVVPFLVFFMLIRKEHMHRRLISVMGKVIDADNFVVRLSRMIHGFVIGNVIIGAIMAGVTIGVLFWLKLPGAVVIGALSGFLNLIPFLGVLLAALLPLMAALVEFTTPGPYLIIIATVLGLHLIAANFLIPKIIGSRVDIGPVAATMGMLFWGWLWGVTGLLLAVPLTAFVKLVADSHPSLTHISNMLAETPLGMPVTHHAGKSMVAVVVPVTEEPEPQEQ